MLKIDAHTHILPKKIPDWSSQFGYGDFVRLQHDSESSANLWKGNQLFRRIHENCWNETLRMEEYAAFSISVQVICTVPVMFSYWANPLDALDISMYLNDHIAKIVTTHPRHYVGLGTVPLQDTELAVRETERCKKIGLAGIQIGSNVNEENLNEERFFCFFEACEKLDMSLLIHPWNMMGMKNMSHYWLPWLVGMPAETTRAICSMIFGGIFKKFPNLRVNFAHGGGSFLHTIGRIEYGFLRRPDLVAIDNDVNPRDYIRKFWVDCITHDISALQHIVALQGSTRVVFGSDYPFPLGNLTFFEDIEKVYEDEESRENIFSRAALEWLNLDKSQFVI